MNLNSNSTLDPQLKIFIRFWDDLKKSNPEKYKTLMSDIYNVCKFLLGEDFQSWTDPEYEELDEFITFFDRMKLRATEDNFDHMVQDVRDSCKFRLDALNKKWWKFW